MPRFAAGVACIVVASLHSTAHAVDADDVPDFNRDIAPILVQRCLECHGESEASGGLVLTTSEGLAKGGDSGEALVVAGKVKASPLLQRVRIGEMPPERKGQSQKLPDDEVKLLTEWIRAGAQWPKGRVLELYEATSPVRAGRDWWSLQPLQRPELPGIGKQPGNGNEIDAFIRGRLNEAGMKPAQQATDRVLIRRLYFDLLGLPPTYEQVETFVEDDSDHAWEQLVDRLLDSPQFGERWARYWLDLVRFAETCGYERDQEKPNAWKYRDWVVDAINDDMPYDRFIIEQLAGDEIENRTEQSVIATGFLRLGTWNDEPNDPQDYKYERLEDLVHATSSAFLGMTFKCARCHDHKFDPIPQVDYYRIASTFWAGPIEPRDGKLLGGPTEAELGFKGIFGWTDLGRTSPPLRLLKNGERHDPRQIVEPASPTLVPALHRPFDDPPPNSKTSHRRLQLAQWIASPKNPLTARVLVNRLWQHHFGKGLVRTPNNFGFRGDPPTHPKLLDWLAAELIASGWKMTRIHKLILMSATYQRSSLHSQADEYLERDSSNRLWWRFERRRLDAEAIRDSLLSVTGEIDLRRGGPGFKPTITPEALEGLSRKMSAWTASSEREQRRRSLYIYTKRGLLPPMMTTFDFADTTAPCGARDVTTVAPQALAMLNNEFTHTRSQTLAERITSLIASKPGGSGSDDLSRKIQLAWRFALGRAADVNELDLARRHLEAQTRRFSKQTGESTRKDPDAWQKLTELKPRDGLVLHLDAGSSVQIDGNGRVVAWKDLSGQNHHATQQEARRRPALGRDRINGRPSVRFGGDRQFLHLAGHILSTEPCTIFAVATDSGSNSGHREIISNWNGGKGNSTTSVFLGLTGPSTIRWTDHYNPAGVVTDRKTPFLLTAVNGETHAAVYQSATEIARRGSRLATRNLNTPWVIGQQGNIDGEYWIGDIAEILVYDRELTRTELQQVQGYLINRYGLPVHIKPTSPPKIIPPDQLALTSLCHVLLNSNEFLYVD